MASQNDPSDANLPRDEQERRAFNRAFRELAFTWYWDTSAYRAMAGISEPRERLRQFLQAENPAILGAYSLDFLVELIAETQQRLMKESFPPTAVPLRGWAPAMHSTESIA
ncbi:MAG: hypothetical protein ABI905_06500 [Betaproteobacteria bacterium]